MRVVIELAGEPRAKQRPRFTRAGHTYTPAATRSYEAALRWAAQETMRGRTPLDGPLYVRVEAYFSIPQSWSKTRQGAAMCGLLKHTGRPDWENVAKTLDAFNGIVWRDDSQVFEGTIVKAYSDRPRLRVVVEPHNTLVPI